MRGPFNGLRRALIAALGLGLIAPLPVLADLTDSVALVKRSIVAVGTFLPTRSSQFRFLGTGFAVGDGRQVATNAHVLEAVPEQRDPNERVVVVLPGVERVNVRAVEREARDRDHDLAVLWIAGTPLPALELADSDTARDGQDIAMTGFPLGASLGVIPVTHRGIIASIPPAGQPLDSAGKLDSATIRRLSAGSRFDVLQLDIVSYPGNSGSPVYDTRNGHVLGVLNMVLVKGMRENAMTNPSGISYAIPVNHLRALLAR